MLKNSSIPLYYQVATFIKNDVIKGKYLTNTTLPSENILAKDYHISRATLRQALESLKQEKIIISRRGLGNIVTGYQKPPKASNFFSTFEDISFPPGREKGKLLDFSFHPASKVIANYLHISEGTEILYIEKIRLFQGSPFSFSQHYILPGIKSKIDIELAKEAHVLIIIENYLKIKITEAAQNVKAEIADSRIADILGIRVGDPLLNVTRVIYSFKNEPVAYQSISYRSDRYNLSVKLLRKKVKGSLNRIWVPKTVDKVGLKH